MKINVVGNPVCDFARQLNFEGCNERDAAIKGLLNISSMCHHEDLLRLHCAELKISIAKMLQMSMDEADART